MKIVISIVGFDCSEEKGPGSINYKIGGAKLLS